MRLRPTVPSVMTGAFVGLAVPLACGTTAEERVTLENVEEPADLSPDEPMAAQFSLRNAARALDQAALHWQKNRKCGTCHTDFAYLIGRPVLDSILPQPPQVRAFFENLVTKRWEAQGPRWDAEVVAAATTLAWHDRATGGDLHPVTRPGGAP